MQPPRRNGRRGELTSGPLNPIQKQEQPHKLCGRRVAVPQEFCGFDDDDGFCFDGTVLRCLGQRCLIRFKYTGEEEWFPLSATRQWLRPELPSIDPLCDQLQRSGFCTQSQA